MGFSLYHRTRSVRLTVTTADGQVVVVENMDGNDGFYLSFDCTRTMDDSPGECTVTAYNLPPDVLGLIEAAQVAKVDDLDALLVGKNLLPQIAADGSDATAAGFLIMELEAGYDGDVSRVFKAVGVRSSTEDDFGRRGMGQARNMNGQFVKTTGGSVTVKTTLTATENLDGALLGLPIAAFTAGTSLFSVVDYLRRAAGLGEGNLSPATLASIIGQSTISSPYVVSGGQALAHLQSVLQYLPLRWFIDDRDIWFCARDEVPSPVIPPAVPWVDDGPPELLPPIIARPQRDDAGRVVVTTFLAPYVRPGRLVRLTPDGLGLAQSGLAGSFEQVAQANVPPGRYRVDEVRHHGDTGDSPFTTSMTLRPVVSPDF